MKPQKRQYGGTQQRLLPVRKLPRLVFTVESLALIKDSFVHFEACLNRQTLPRAQLPFAREVFNNVKQKVEEMLLLQGKEVFFDSNEIVIIRACLQIYFGYLLHTPPSPQREQLILQCAMLGDDLPIVPPIRLHD
jgi:hypothetical protein